MNERVVPEQSELIGLISVVIPVGATGPWLDEAVASILAERELPLELIAVFNHGATVPEDWPFLRDPRVRTIYTPESLGPAGAGQRGIDAARGEFLACLDADDIAYPDRLRRQAEWLRAHPETVLVSSQVAWIDGESKQTGAFELPSGTDIRPQLVGLNVAPHSSWMIRMSDLRAVGGYNLAMHQMEDYDLLLRIGVRGPIASLPETLTGYRLHPEQMSRVVRPNGDYIAEIARGRAALGRALGMSGARVLASRIRWEAEQWIMFFGRKLRG